MTGQGIEPGGLRAQMVAQLEANTSLARWEAALRPWWPALASVPRHSYVPDIV